MAEAPEREPRWRRALAEAEWLTPLRALQIAILFAAVNLIVVISLMKGYAEATPETPGSAIPDFAAFWAASVAVLDGDPLVAYDRVAHRAIQSAALGWDYPYWLEFSYPPNFLLLVAPVGLLPLFVSFALWSVATLALFLWVSWRILPGPVTLLAGWGAATTMSVFAIGQTGFLTAALLGLALLDLDRRPYRAGGWLALLTIKPQLGIAIPVALVAGRRWRAILAGAAAFVLFMAATHLALGPEIWEGFLQSLRRSAAILERAQEAFVMQASLYGWMRLLGAPFELGMAGHAVAALPAAALVAMVWASDRAPADLKAAVLCYGMAIVTPRLLYYDMHILFIGALFQVRHGLAHGFTRWEKVLMIFAQVLAFQFVLMDVAKHLVVNAFVGPVLMLSLLGWRFRALFPRLARGAAPAE